MEPLLKSYVDADWIGDKTKKNTTSGNLFLLGQNTIHSITKNQSCVSLSSAKAEYISAVNSAQETI